MINRVFLDSNVWIYLFAAEDDRKSRTAREYITENAKKHLFVLSYQVINEVCSVLIKKKYKEPEIRRVAGDMMGLCDICANSNDVVFFASELREEHAFSYWDSLIIASAIVSRCDLLVSEDMQDGRIIGGLLIKDIFMKNE